MAQLVTKNEVTSKIDPRDLNGVWTDLNEGMYTLYYKSGNMIYLTRLSSTWVPLPGHVNYRIRKLFPGNLIGMEITVRIIRDTAESIPGGHMAFKAAFFTGTVRDEIESMKGDQDG